MGIFDFLFGNNTKQEQPRQPSQVTQKDERKAECPYCKGALTKVPGSKTKCPHCGEFMFVRTRPKDQARVVVTKAEADAIEEEWSIVNGTHDFYLAEKDKVRREREMLKQRFGGKEPSENDVAWSLLNKDAMECAQRGDWGLYRNAKFNMGEVLRKEMKLKDALRMYLEVCYLDANGPNNVGGFGDEWRKEFPAFNPSSGAFIAPGVIDLIKRLTKKLEMDQDGLKLFFIDHCKRVHQALKLPLSPEDAWGPIVREL